MQVLTYPDATVDLALGAIGLVALAFGATGRAPSVPRAVALAVGYAGVWQGYRALVLVAPGEEVAVAVGGGALALIAFLIRMATLLDARRTVRTLAGGGVWVVAMFVALALPITATNKEELVAVGRLEGPAATLAVDDPATLPALLAPGAAPVRLTGVVCDDVRSFRAGSTKRPKTLTYTHIAGGPLWIAGTCDGLGDSLLVRTRTPARMLPDRPGEEVPVMLLRVPPPEDVASRGWWLRALGGSLVALTLLVVATRKRSVGGEPTRSASSLAPADDAAASQGAEPARVEERPNEPASSEPSAWLEVLALYNQAIYTSDDPSELYSAYVRKAAILGVQLDQPDKAKQHLAKAAAVLPRGVDASAEGARRVEALRQEGAVEEAAWLAATLGE